MQQISVISAGAYELDLDRRALKGERGEAELSPLACRFLRALARQPGRIVSRAELIDDLWSGNHLVGEPALNRLVSETRRTVRSAGDENLIETVQKTGYRLVGSSQAEHSAARRAAGNARLIRWAFVLVAFVVVVVGLQILIDSATGLAWVARNGD
jgi:DNA-binding winged helix-turn-helix (wHTH) protein